MKSIGNIIVISLVRYVGVILMLPISSETTLGWIPIYAEVTLGWSIFDVTNACFHSFWQLDQISIKSAVTSNLVELRVTVWFTSNILKFWMGWESGWSHHTISYILLDMYVGIEAWVTNGGVLCGRVTGLLYLNIVPFSPINTGFWPSFKPPVRMLFDRFRGVIDI